MRVLLYIEPHPIRNSYTHFDDIARKFLPLLSSRDDLDVRMFASARTLEKAGAEAAAPYADRLIRPSADEEAIFERYMKDWHSEGISLWLELLHGQGEVTEAYLHMLRRIWRTFPFDIIVHWAENGAVTRFLNERPITRIAMELGCTRAPFFESVIMDPFGTNGSGVVPRLSVTDLREIVEGRTMSSHEAIMAYSKNLETLPYEQQFSMIQSDLSGRLFRNRPLVFLPLQLYDDANLLRFSPYQSLTDVVLNVVPKLVENGYTVIIKPHPASKYRPNAMVANSLAHGALREWSENVIWCDRLDPSHSNTQLIRIADFVVTVNSSVGFEALYFDKPVVVLGDAVYKPQGLFPTVDQMISGDFDQKEYLEGIGYLRRFFLGGYLQRASIRSDAALFDERLGLIHGLQEQYPDDPVAFARNFWRSVSPKRQALARAVMFAGRSTPGQGEFGKPQLPIEQAGASAQSINRDIDPECAPYIKSALKLIAASKTSDPETFNSWLNALLAEPDGQSLFVQLAELLDPEYYLARYDDLRAAQVDPFEHFVSWGFLEERSPRASMAGASFELTLALLQKTARAILQGGPIADFPLAPAQEESRREQLDQIRSALSHSGKRIAVVAHLYYRDLVPEILAGLDEIPESFDLIVTVPDWGAQSIIKMVRDAYPDAVIYRAANRGRDIGPFMDILPILIDRDYEAVLKIQTKRGYYVAGRIISELGDLWRKETFCALMGNKGRVADILTAFRTDPSITMVGPNPYYQPLASYPYHDGGYLARLLLNDSEGTGFFAGTMFWVKPNCLRALAGTLNITSFSNETGANDGAIAHLIERLFGHAATMGEGRICGAPVDPEEPIEPNILPAPVTIHNHLTETLKLSRQDVPNWKAALAW